MGWVSVMFCREAAQDHSPGLQPWVGKQLSRPEKHLQPRGRGVQFRQGAMLQYSKTPSLRSPEFEDDDEDEDEKRSASQWRPSGGCRARVSLRPPNRDW